MSNIIAVLGPTNTGKTHRAIERMLDFPTGMIGLPLRLLAREVYDRVTARVGEDKVALITGEEKRVPPLAVYWVCTVEAMPVSKAVDFIAIDEIQLCAHPQRGHVFTDRLLHTRGEKETWFLGSDSMRDLIQELVPVAQIQTHPRLSQLSFAGARTLSQIRPRSVVVAFTVGDVYTLADRLRVNKGGTAVVLGALSPRTRNSQVAMFQSGEVDYLVATDAIGMGLNLDVAHVVFAALEKFDGREQRQLELAELGQIAGRAGRHLKDGTFGTLSPVELPLWAAQAIEQQKFPALRRLSWREHDLDFSSAEALIASLRTPSKRAVLIPVEHAEDTDALTWLSQQPDVRSRLGSEARVRLLWDVATVPDFRKLMFETHVQELREIFLGLCDGPLASEWIEKKVKPLSDTTGDVETLIFRITSLRTWAYVAQRAEWLAQPMVWRDRTVAIEDRLSDALHGALVQRFVSKQGKARKARKDEQPKIAPAPKVAADHPFAGLRSMRDQLARAAANIKDAPEETRFEALVDAAHEAFSVDGRGVVTADIDGEALALARLHAGRNLRLPDVKLEPLPFLSKGLRSRLERRLNAFARDLVSRLVAPVALLEHADSAAVRSLGYELVSQLGSADASKWKLTERDRDILRKEGIHLGRLTLHAPRLLERWALAQRMMLTTVYRGPVTLERADQETLLTLGHVRVGRQVLRQDAVD